MPKETNYTKLNVSDKANEEIDTAHLRAMIETGSKITKRAFIDSLVAVALEHESELVARFQNRERVNA